MMPAFQEATVPPTPVTVSPQWHLTAEEMRTCRVEGLVRPRLKLDDAHVAEMRDLLDTTLSASVGQRPESLVCPHIPIGYCQDNSG